MHGICCGGRAQPWSDYPPDSEPPTPTARYCRDPDALTCPVQVLGPGLAPVRYRPVPGRTYAEGLSTRLSTQLR